MNTDTGNSSAGYLFKQANCRAIRVRFSLAKSTARSEMLRSNGVITSPSTEADSNIGIAQEYNCRRTYATICANHQRSMRYPR